MTTHHSLQYSTAQGDWPWATSVSTVVSTSLFGRLDCGTGLREWTEGLDWGTGLWDWTEGLDWGTGFTESCTHHIETAHTLLHYSILSSHVLNSGQIAITRYQYHQDQMKFQQPFLPVSRLYKYVYVHWRKPDKHWPLSNGSTVNIQSHTLIQQLRNSLSPWEWLFTNNWTGDENLHLSQTWLCNHVYEVWEFASNNQCLRSQHRVTNYRTRSCANLNRNDSCAATKNSDTQ